MAYKKYLAQVHAAIRPIKTWYLVVGFLLFAGLSIYGLRSNFQTMVHLREAVYQADRNGAGVETALQQLRTHVNGHMNTDLSSGAETIYPPIQLKETYARLVAAEQARAEATNTKAYSDAQAHCERLHPAGTLAERRVPCIEEYIKAHGTNVRPIPEALYKFDFASPQWSPDFAGWSMVCAGLLLVLAVIRFVLERWIRSAGK